VESIKIITKNIMETKKSFASNGFLYNPKKQEVLLHLRDGHATTNPNKWAFFGGAGEGGETAAECCSREIKEELNIDIPVEDLILLRDYLIPDYITEKRCEHQHSYYIESDIPKSEMILSEGADFDWVPLDKVFEYDMSDETVESLKMFIEKIEE
jgi:8-oxo-dGTP pyrophosphatase MutT (NUDIX family)